MDEFYTGMQLKVNAGKRKMMVFEREEVRVVDKKNI